MLVDAIRRILPGLNRAVAAPVLSLSSFSGGFLRRSTGAGDRNAHPAKRWGMGLRPRRVVNVVPRSSQGPHEAAKDGNGVFQLQKGNYRFLATEMPGARDHVVISIGAPAFGHAVVFDELELAALGDWIQRRVLK